MDLFYVCLLICAGIYVVTPQHLSSTPKGGTLRPELLAPTPLTLQSIGRWISLQCPIESWDNYRISWSKILSSDNTSDLDISIGTELVVHDDRYSLVEDPVRRTIKLKIQNLKTTDSGLYQCRAIGPNGERSFYSRMELQVRQ